MHRTCAGSALPAHDPPCRSRSCFMAINLALLAFAALLLI